MKIDTGKIVVFLMSIFFINTVSSITFRLIDDVLVTKTVNKNNPCPGDIITYTITAKNQTIFSLLTTVTDVLPAGVTYISSSTASGSYNPANGTWSISLLLPTFTATLTINARININMGGKTITNTATSTLNSSSVSIKVQNIADIQVKKQ